MPKINAKQIIYSLVVIKYQFNSHNMRLIDTAKYHEMYCSNIGSV